MGARLDEPFFLPDSLPYRTGMASTALVACSVAVESAVEESHQLVHHAAALVPDPRDASVSWVQVALVGQLYMPVAFSYSVDVIVPPEAVVDGSASGAPGPEAAEPGGWSLRLQGPGRHPHLSPARRGSRSP